MQRAALLAILALNACHRTNNTAVAPVAPTRTVTVAAQKEAPLSEGAMLLPTSGDDPHNIGIVYGREENDPGWVPTIAALEATERPIDDTFSLFRTAHSVAARGQTLYKEANRLYTFLNTSTSYYAHMTYMNEETGTRRTDCSGYVDYAVRRVLPDAYDKVPHPNTQRPLANDWYKFLKERYQTVSTQEAARWREIIHVRELVPGDLVVWLKPENVTGDNTGHIMIVTATPTAGRSGEYLVRIADSTSSPHANDSRGTTRTGIGTGTIGLKVDGWDRPTAYYWRGGLSYTAFDTPIAMGRVE